MKTAHKLVCLRCDRTEFAPAEGAVPQEFRGETLTVRAPVMRCAHCGWETLAPGQLDTLRQRTADAFREKHGLLTGGEIRRRREAMAMSQRDFATYLEVGPASVPRWETWQVQEPVYDALIRRKTEMALWSEIPMHTILEKALLLDAALPAWWPIAAGGMVGPVLPDAFHGYTVGQLSWSIIDDAALPPPIACQITAVHTATTGNAVWAWEAKPAQPKTPPPPVSQEPPAPNASLFVAA